MRKGPRKRPFPKEDISPPKEKSRSQLKREMTALQKIGEELAVLSPQLIPYVELPEEILEAVVSARSLKPCEARRRQLQYIGVLMRRIAPGDMEELEKRLRRIQKTGRRPSPLPSDGSSSA